MLNDNPFFYVNHLILFGIWTAFHGTFLHRKESQNTFFLKLYLAITINALINFALFYLFADFFSVNLIRTLFTVIMLYLVLRLMVRDTRMNTLFAVLFHVLCLVISEMLAILIMLAGSGFDQHAFEEASFFTTSGFLVMDGIQGLLFGLILILKKKVFPNIDWQKQARLVPLLAIHAGWIYLLSYKLIYAYEMTVNLTGFLIVSWICVQGASFFLIRSLLKMKTAKERAELEHQNNLEIQAQLMELHAKQSVMNKVWASVQSQASEWNVDQIRAAYDQIGSIRNSLYCDHPSVNALLASFQRQFDAKDIEFTVEIKASFASGFDDFDLNTLLANLLKNALEAAQDSPQAFVHLTITQHKQMILIRCENTNGRMHSSPKLIQGNGKKIITQLAERYHGQARWNKQARTTTAEVLLNKDDSKLCETD